MERIYYFRCVFPNCTLVFCTYNDMRNHFNGDHTLAAILTSPGGALFNMEMDIAYLRQGIFELLLIVVFYLNVFLSFA